MTDSSAEILFYDIASGPPVTCFAPNPWKTRYALNFKAVPYRTEWVELPEVTSVRQTLGAPPNRTLPDGSPFYTLPIIKDLSTGDVVGDSFDIAVFLDKAYPQRPLLFPPSTIGLQAAFNVQVDAIFSPFAILCAHGIPFNPLTAEESKATFVERSGSKDWDDMTVRGEDRVKTIEDFRKALEGLAKVYKHREGPFLDGGQATYADLIVGGWLSFMKATLPAEEWEQLQSWQDGLWAKLHLGLEEYAQVK